MTNETDGQSLLNFATAREILLLEAQKLMPKGAKDQRNQSLKVMEIIMADTLAHTKLPPEPEGKHELRQKAYAYLKSLTGTAASQPKATPYEALCDMFMRLSNLGLAGAAIEWVHSTHSLPDITPEVIEDASAAMGVFSQRILLNPEARGWVKAVCADKTLQGEAACNAKLICDNWTMQAGMSEEFVDAMSRAGSASFRTWEKAKSDSDFETWLPYFTEVVKYAREKSVLLGKALDVPPYQALLEQYNAGLKNETVNIMFDQLHAKLPGLIKTIMAKQANHKPLPLPDVPLPTQRKIIARLIDALGFEPDYSRIDESMHPFSTGEWDDVRVTTHYHADNLLSSIMGVVHEMGHLFYSRYLPRKWKHQPIGGAQSMWIHESQSLFWEKQVGCSPEFVEFLAELIAQEIPDAGEALGSKNLYALITRVEPGFIRIQADEVTYPAHIILRHTIEQQIIEKKLEPADLPGVWAEAMKELLGVTVPDHAHGCMQDVHWTDGSFGYFPAYSFGALAAAQFMQKARSELPDISGMIRKGNFAPIKAWLKEHIHEIGSRYDGEELVRRVTGKPLSIEPWLAHIEERYVNA